MKDDTIPCIIDTDPKVFVICPFGQLKYISWGQKLNAVSQFKIIVKVTRSGNIQLMLPIPYQIHWLLKFQGTTLVGYTKYLSVIEMYVLF